MFLKSFIKKQQFQPSLLGVFVNPFYISRKNLFNHIKCNSHYFKGGRLLDVGCGTKPYKNLFSVNDYIGLDIIDGGHDNLAKDVDVFYDGKRIPFKDNSIDYVLCNEVIEHVSDPREFITEINRVLIPGGLVLISAPFIWDEHEEPYDYWRFTSFGLIGLVSNKFHILYFSKSGNYIETETQLWSEYVFRTGFNKYIATIFICSFIQIIGLVLSKILPESKTLYLDTVLVGVK